MYWLKLTKGNFFVHINSYVNRKGWQHYFKSYCIPEDLVPRILSPAYFHHYNAQPLSMPIEKETTTSSMLKHEEAVDKLKENEGERLVLGLGPVQSSFWRLSKLVPLDSVRRYLNKYRVRKVGSVEAHSMPDSAATNVVEDEVVEAQSLEIQEGSDGISLKPIDTDKDGAEVAGRSSQKSAAKNGDGRRWRQVPYLPSYVPFGQV